MEITDNRLLCSAGLVLMGNAFSPAQAAGYQCYDFSELPSGTAYTVGDTFLTRYARVEVKPYFTQGDPATATIRQAKSVQTAIAGGIAPELSLYLVSVNVVPVQAVTEVRTRVAQSIAQDGSFANANIEVNGERYESAGGFADMDARVIGDPNIGRATIHTELQPPTGNWHAGELLLRANPGETIQSFTLGGHTWRIDDLCFAI